VKILPPNGATSPRLRLHSPEDRREQVIRVDPRDRATGSAGKLEAHEAGLLHRAFSIYVVNGRGEMLLQRRAGCKYHFAGLWSNTCCGHPRPGERTKAAAARRLNEELGFSTRLSEVSQLVYRARDPVSGLVEHEYLHVFEGTFGGEPLPNPSEVDAWRWMSIPQVRVSLRQDPGGFTPWFALLFTRLFPDAGEARRLA
jgi:isopentenyl-diphosphate delta-isomerase